MRKRAPVRFFQRLPGRLIPFSEQTLSKCIPVSMSADRAGATGTVTFRAYLEGVERFVRENWDRLQSAILEVDQDFSGTIKGFDVISEKHGSDYHPARVMVTGDHCAYSFVANVAVTERGRARLATEFSVLKSLYAKHDRAFVPRVYFRDDLRTPDENGHSLPMEVFLGEWLEGYHEFHLSPHPEAGDLAMALWDMDRGTAFLSDGHAREVYRQAAFVLTHYFDPETFHEIFPWHHAAGDFVVACSGDRVDVKLIAARQYAPRVEFAQRALDNQVYALLLFFANLTIRMRLDRSNGVGEIVWADEYCLDGSVEGFVEAMRQKVAAGRCSTALWSTFVRVARDMPPDEMADLFASVVESYPEEAPDIPVIQDHLVDHIVRVYQHVRNLSSCEDFLSQVR